MSQRELADLAKTSSGAISLIESGKRTPGSNVLERMASALGVTTDYLLGVKESKDLRDYVKDPQVEAILEEMENLSKKKKELVLKFIRTIASEE